MVRIWLFHLRKISKLEEKIFFLKHYLSMNEPKVCLFTRAEHILKDSKTFASWLFTVEIDVNSKYNGTYWHCLKYFKL